jgi:hypothetical protein
MCHITVWQETLSPAPQMTLDGSSLRPSHVEPDSLLGFFLRQLLVECNGLGFEGLSALLDRVQDYAGVVEGPQGPEEGEGGQEEASQLSLDCTSEQVQTFLQVGLPVLHGSKDTYRSLEGVYVMCAQQRVLSLDKDLGVRSPSSTEAELEALMRPQRCELPRAHFLRFLNSKANREFAGALDALHRYFDYAVRRWVVHELSKRINT